MGLGRYWERENRLIFFFFEDVASGGLRMQLSEIVAFQMESPYSFPWVLKACDKLLRLASGHTAGRQRKKSEDLT